MAIHHLLWSCPLCGAGRLTAKDVCAACGTRYRRGRGDRILAAGPREKTERPAAEWLADLPPPKPSSEPEPVRWRVREPSPDPVVYDGDLIGWVERFGPWREGSLTLRENAIVLESGPDLRTIPLEDLATLQTVSGGTQLRLRDGTVIGVRLVAGSVLRWERLLEAAIRRRWDELGRGDVFEFQPRIVAR